MDKFFIENEAGAGALGRRQSREIVKTNIYWVENNLKDLREYLFKKSCNEEY